MTTTPPIVSVVVPAYNSARTLTTTVDSILQQTVHDLEVIVVDDGSSDDTVEMARGIPDNRVRVVTQANGGASRARNTGIREAAGTWVAFLDSDDVWLSTKLERQLAYLAAHPDVYAVQTGAAFVDDNLQVLYLRPCHPSRDALMESLFFDNLPSFPSTLLIRRQKLEEIGYFDTGLEILEDWEMAIRAARYCNLKSIEEPLTLYRTHPGNRSLDLDIHIAPGLLVLQRLFTDPDLPERIRARRRSVYARLYMMLAGGSLRVGHYRGCARWAVKALWMDPRSLRYMAELPVRRVARVLSGWSTRRRGGAAALNRALGAQVEG